MQAVQNDDGLERPPYKRARDMHLDALIARRRAMDHLRERGETLSLAALEQIDQTCLEFEAAWKAGQRPSIEPRLAEWQGPQRAELLRQLQPLAATFDWDRQRRKWLRLVRRRIGRRSDE